MSKHMIIKVKELVSAGTHMLWALLAIPVTVILAYCAYKYATIWHLVSFIIFGVSLFLLYTASTLYHMFYISPKVTSILHRIDHMMIFVLIAGTYTPVCLVPLRGAWGYSLLAVIWVFAIVGIIIKAVWMNAPRILSTLIYLIMGWAVVVAFYPLIKSVTLVAVVLLVLGGLAYSVGAVIYAFKWPKINLKFFGFHEIFHLFVMGGSAFHVAFMFNCIAL